MHVQIYYQEILKNHFAAKVRRNPLYSLRKFAFDLKFSAGALSHIIWGRRIPTEGTARKLADSLRLSNTEKKKFIESALNIKKLKTSVKTEYLAVEESQDLFDQIWDWYHYAILEYSYIEHADFSSKHIAKLFGITESQSQMAVDRLLKLGLLQNKDNVYRKTKDRFSLAQKHQTSNNLRKRQIQILEKAIDAIQTLPIEERVAAAMTMAIDKDKIELARKLIDRSLNEICDLLASENPTDVFELQITFIPLTKKRD